ncbi:serine-type D-Ala-D-Ala carboxypeptidase [Erwinia sp. OLTSP20]|uniref:serine hydrolase n=1 Tax=unclassified Erwinia TaxID=2622719 RepID=UPI000C17DB17|nr:MULTISPECIES: serine hydrolase [unclassified Erwinia]PIJ51275.1 serine-type D-Ala-D-Ala carboxypeptidase [Erwinia sp. OAMSP11]PIJ74061.1 serine-type D-Ala-D-Ala carboxypeptidase [Erwinia sp. OLSSP12]PIJ81167.1 serine-type D-Ala-D-Ala carboxypeptidase [Erwinia sp. OLCASP19]PIJ86024.1 serine-type D-Ala-D-Ala carboxypeptidase [Erwinia sp. OLMTSP26]PIJ87773.1 serine-type D-Ala-D-Ala carboxypeptidase [Erwinia sp. OLMDSP33]
MKKITLPAIISTLARASLLMFFSPFSFAEDVAAAPQIEARAWVLMDYHSGKILAGENVDQRLDPASLTKMMASYVIGQAIKSGRIAPENIVTIGNDAWATGNPLLQGSSLMFLKPGDRVSVADLNRGIVIQSGNDASIALADYIAGSQDAFVSLMNRYAGQLGLNNTHFATVHGLDSEKQYSTSRDMALIGQALIHDVPDEYALNKEKVFTFNKIRQMNRNRLLWSSHLNVDGIKTGYTNGAGYNLVSSATDANQRLIAVVLGAKSDAIRFRESEKLLSWGFRYFETVIPVKAGNVFTTQRVWYGDRRQVTLGVAEDAAMTIPKGQLKNLTARLVLNQPQLQAPLNKNQVVGTIDFQLNNKTIGQRPLVVQEEVKEGGIFSRIWDFIVLKISILLSKWFG